MPSALVQALPFTSAVASLVGRTLKIRQLQGVPLNESFDKDHLTSILVEVFTIGAICALAAEGGREGSVFKGAFIGTVAAIVAYILPKLYISPMLKKHCGSCTQWGTVGLGITMLLILYICLSLLNWFLLS